MKRVSLLRGVFGALLWMAAGGALALPEDRNQPIKITADSAELDDGKGLATYQGEVKLVQGTLEINADILTIRTDGNGIQQLTAIGQPAHYQQQTELDTPLTHGYGLRIEYDVVNNQITLIREARLERAADTFVGERIQIDTERNLVNATGSESPGDKPQRVEMVIQPRANNQ
ncbi:lipopolysaccharide transport periplasmic protein LptA [Motiliproteus sediminis]|uniref:lipopolysaccharide transport periplasmic protein LptA n=1 Tax=Motiliproteus sediminis TaxID=1468178 RepID=UPI001AEF4390|nr:lipopolysaccharide transport periplasmic protein LptA [Motiliproteus sediminis]